MLMTQDGDGVATGLAAGRPHDVKWSRSCFARQARLFVLFCTAFLVANAYNVRMASEKENAKRLRLSNWDVCVLAVVISVALGMLFATQTDVRAMLATIAGAVLVQHLFYSLDKHAVHQRHQVSLGSSEPIPVVAPAADTRPARLKGLAFFVLGAVMLGLGIVLTLSSWNKILYGLVGVGAYFIIRGLIMVSSGRRIPFTSRLDWVLWLAGMLVGLLFAMIALQAEMQ